MSLLLPRLLLLLLFGLLTIPLSVRAQCDASFTISDNMPCGDEPVTFTINDPDPTYTYDWDFGQGSTATGDSVTFTYPPPPSGSEAFFVALTATDTLGNSCSTLQPVNVQGTPTMEVTDLNYDPVNDTAPFVFCVTDSTITSYQLDVQLTSSDAAQISFFTVDWGDGSPVDSFNGSDLPIDMLSHTYTEQGRFEITIDLTGTDGCDNSIAIFVFNGTNPAVGLETPGGTVGLCAPRTLSFPITGTFDNSPGTTYEIFINDSLVANYDHPPPSVFTYTFTETTCGLTSPSGDQNAIAVRIVANTPCSASSATIAPVTLGSRPMTAIGADPPAGACEGEVVTFTNETMGAAFVVNQQCNDAVNLQWRIQPDTGWTLASGALTGNSLGPANEIGVLFNQVGVYEVELVTENGCGVDSTTLVYEILDLPIADAETAGSGCAPSTYTFTNASANNLTNEWTVTPAAGWAFANGTSAFSENPSLLFTEPGAYTVALTVTNSCGDDDWDTTLVIQGRPIVAVDDIDDFCESAAFAPTAAVDENGCATQSCVWSFPGGNPTSFNGCDPGEITFDIPGDQLVILTVTNCCGSTSDTATFFIEEPITNIDAGGFTVFCAGDPCLDLSAQGFPAGGTWTDSTGTTVTEFCPDQTGDYVLYYSVGTGLCQAVDSLLVTVHPVPALTLLDNQALFCEDDSAFTFTADPPGGAWTGPGIDGSDLFLPASAGVGAHTVTYTYQDPGTGCGNSLAFDLTVAGLEGLALTDETFCLTAENIDLEDYFGLTETNGTGVWTGPGFIQSDDGIFNPVDAAGGLDNDTTVTVIYTFTTSEGCVSADTADLLLIPLTLADAGPDTTICITGGALQLTANLPGNWYGEEISTGGEVDLDAAGEGIWPYEFVAFEGESCESRDTMVVTIIDLGELDAGPDQYVCESETDLLFSGFTIPDNVTESWSGEGVGNPGIPLVDIDALAEDLTYTYVLAVESNAIPGCIATDSLDLTVAALPQVSFTTDEEICRDSLVSFTIDTAGVDSVSWMFGPLGMSAEFNPEFSFSLPGNFNVKVTAFSFNPLQPGAVLCSMMYADTITVGQEPQLVAFAADTEAGCADLEVTLTNNSIGDNLNYEWYLGDTLFSTQTNPDLLTLGQGRTDTTYLVRLEVANGCGGQTAERELTVFPRPIPVFGTDFDEYCSGDTVSLSNVSYGNVDNYFWIFGEGDTFQGTSTDSLAPPVNFFVDETTVVPISLIVSNSCGIDTLVQTITINPTNVEAFFNTDGTEICAGDTICFTNFSTFIADIVYDFGDGNSTTDPNPCHVYDLPGTYTVTQWAYACGFDSTTAVIQVASRPEVAFAAPEVVCTGAPVSFTNASTGAVAYEWDFGDGGSSVLASPVHSFDSAGIYTVLLTGGTAQGCQDEAVRTIEVLPLPVADFAFADSICAGEVVAFENLSTGDIQSCTWDFGNGNVSSFCDPQQLYALPGQYPGTLTVTDAAGCKDTISQLVYVRGVPEPAFTVALDGSCSPVTATFTNNSANATSYVWSFGDGMASDQTNPVHTFTAGGDYTVQLMATNEGICTELATQVLTIFQTPEAAFSLPALEGCAPATFSFANNSTGDISAYQWDFGDMLTSFESDPEHTYPEPGTYEVILQVETADQCTDDTSALLTVHPAVTAGYGITDINCAGELTGAIDLTPQGGTPPFSYNWSNGAAGQDLSGLPAGDYGLTITDSNGCRWEDTVPVAEPPAITLALTGETVVSCFGGADGELRVEATGGIPPYTYQWSDQSSGQVLSGVTAGDYGLTVTDVSGCELAEELTVSQRAPLTVLDSLRSISCFGRRDGVITLDSIYGGVPPYEVELAGPEGLLPPGDRFAGLPAGAYELTVIDANGCLLQRDYTLQEPAGIFVDILTEETVLLMGDSLELATNYNALEPSFAWTPERGLDCPFCDAPMARPLRDVTYRVEMTDRNGCTVTDSVFIEVRPLRALYFPNAFSPDGDGYNDVFMVRSGDPGLRAVREFRVYDRWGAQLFSAADFQPNDPDFGWDGRGRNDEDLQPGVFTWFAIVEFVDGEVKEYAGEILLIR